MPNPRLSRRGLLAALAASPAAAALLSQAAHAAGDLAGSGLVGDLQGPTMITDPAHWPKKFQEAPMLADRVKAGKLPPVEQRIPAEPMVWQPLNEIGKYGGTWRRAFTGPGDVENGNRINASDKCFFWSADGSKIVPSVAKAYELSDDGQTYTLHLRRGMKWSDGAPFSADDFVFWFQDIYGNKEIVPTPIPDMQPKGKPGRIVKVDDVTVRFEFDVPYYLFEEMMAGDTNIGGGQSVRQSGKLSFGAYSPAHYLKQFLPKYSSVEAVNARAKQEGFENWVQMLHFKKDWSLNTELAHARRLEDRAIHQQPGLAAGAQSVLLRRRYGRQPASLPRQGAADPGRQSGGHQPARHGRRLRRAGTSHGHQQAAGDPG